MELNEIHSEAELITSVYLSIARSFHEQNLQVSEDTLKSLTATIYIQQHQKKKSYSGGNRSYGGGGGSYQAKDPNAPKKKCTPPVGQNMTVGVPCLKCGKVLKQSKAGNPYCGCWFN